MTEIHRQHKTPIKDINPLGVVVEGVVETGTGGTVAGRRSQALKDCDCRWGLAVWTAGPLEGCHRARVKAEFIVLRDLGSWKFEGFGMSTRCDHCAMTRAGRLAAPAAALILGGLLLLSRP